MTTLFNAMLNEVPTGKTANGATTYATSLSACLDLFNVIGSSRGKNINNLVSAALKENAELAVRIVLHARDCRGGHGERKTVTDIIEWMMQNGHDAYAKAIIKRLPELGYWKDVIKLYNKNTSSTINPMIKFALRGQDGLCAKYMPRKGAVAARIRKYIGWNEAQWRKTIVGLSKTVEQQMCAKQWGEIEYQKVPSVAAMRYSKAFGRNDTSRYGEYIEKLNKGEAKVNASVLTPVEVMHAAIGHNPISEAQWKALPNYMEGSNQRILPVIDVSGSMGCGVHGTNYSCKLVAISLGMYLAERSESVFKDLFITFSERPAMVKVSGSSLVNRYANINRANWGYNTDIVKTFETILNNAKSHRVPASQMPTMIVILSDMEFDQNGTKPSYEVIRQQYIESGYELPKIVFWNLNARAGNNPVNMRDKDVCTVSGFNPSIMKSVLGAKEFNPYDIMLETVMVDRYKFV